MVATTSAGDALDFFRVNNAGAPVVSADPTAYGEGFLYLGSCVDNGACTGTHMSAITDADPTAGTVQATLLASGLTIDDTISVTATDASGNTSEFGAFFYTTGVDLIAFTATGHDSAILILWETAQEFFNLGFHLYRALSEQGPFMPITDRLIPAELFATMGHVYTYTDQPVIPGATYYYQLEDIDTNGTRTLHDPIRVDWIDR